MPVYKDNAVNRRLGRVGKEYGKIDRSKPPPPPPGPPPKKKKKSQKPPPPPPGPPPKKKKKYQKPPPPPPGPPPKKKQEKKIKKKTKNTPQYQRLLDRSKARKAKKKTAKRPAPPSYDEITKNEKKKPAKDAFEGLNDSDFDDIMPTKPKPKKAPQKAVVIPPKKRQVNVPIRKVAPKAFPTSVLLDKLNEDVYEIDLKMYGHLRRATDALKKKYPKKADVVAFVKSKNYPKKLQRSTMYEMLGVLAREEVLATPFGKEYTRIHKIKDDAYEERYAAERARDPNKLYYGQYLPPIPYSAMGKAGFFDQPADPKLREWAIEQLNDNPYLEYPKKYTPNPFEGQERPNDDFDRLATQKGRSRADVIMRTWDDMEEERERQEDRERSGYGSKFDLQAY